MSQELIDAAASGDTATVVRLLDDPMVDINFPGNYDGWDFQATALVAAIANEKWGIAKILIQHAARLIFNGDDFPEAIQTLCGFIYAFTHAEAADFNTLKLMLTKVNNLNIKLSFKNSALNGSIVNFFDYPEHVCPQRIKKATIFLYEAILRCNMVIMGEFVDKKIQVDLNSETFAKYLEYREMRREEVLNAKTSIDYLITNKLISCQLALEFKKLIIEHGIKLGPEKLMLQYDLPAPLQKHLATPPRRTLNELFCELQYHLSQHAIPANSVDGDVFKGMNQSLYDTSEEGLKGLRAQQNPTMLRKLLNLDPTIILLSLNVCSTNENENPAVLLLAEIFLYYADKIIKVNGEDELFLTEKQKQTCLSVLKSFYSLTNLEKILLSLHREQKDAVAALTDQNRILQSDMRDLTDQSKRMEEKLDKMMQLLSLKVNEMTPPPRKMSPRLLG